MFATSKRVGMAVADYQMLEEGDKILVAVSGGKDSLSLLKLLKYRLEFIPIDIELMAVHIDMGVPDFPVGALADYFNQEGLKWHIEKIDILKDDQEWEDINCFWCSWNRRKTLFQLAQRFGFNKIALGHHMDDIVETMLLNLFYQGEISTMRPLQVLFDGKLTLIRPLAYVEEKNLKRLTEKEHIPDLDRFSCPHNDVSKRKAVKDIIATLGKTTPGIKKNIFKSLERVKEEYLLSSDAERLTR